MGCRPTFAVPPHTSIPPSRKSRRPRASSRPPGRKRQGSHPAPPHPPPPRRPTLSLCSGATPQGSTPRSSASRLAASAFSSPPVSPSLFPPSDPFPVTLSEAGLRGRRLSLAAQWCSGQSSGAGDKVSDLNSHTAIFDLCDPGQVTSSGCWGNNTDTCFSGGSFQNQITNCTQEDSRQR